MSGLLCETLNMLDDFNRQRNAKNKELNQEEEKVDQIDSSQRREEEKKEEPQSQRQRQNNMYLIKADSDPEIIHKAA